MELKMSAKCRTKAVPGAKGTSGGRRSNLYGFNGLFGTSSVCLSPTRLGGAPKYLELAEEGNTKGWSSEKGCLMISVQPCKMW